MSVPSLENGPWTFNVSNTFSDATPANVAAWSVWEIKEILAGFSQWSVVASTDGTTVRQVGAGSPDLWTAYTDIVEDSWIILENTTTGEQVCFHMTSPGLSAIEIYWSPLGSYASSGGTTTSPPSASSDEEEIFPAGEAGVYFIGTAVAPDRVSVSGMISNDGKCTRIFVRQKEGSTYGTQVLFFEELVDTPSEWTSTNKRCVYKTYQTDFSATGTAQGPVLSDADNQKWCCRVDHASLASANVDAYGTAECYGASLTGGSGIAIMNVATTLDWVTGGIASPIGIFRPDISYGGSFGRIQDMYWAPAHHDSLDTYPSGGSKTWIKFGCFLVPWNGSSPTEAP